MEEIWTSELISSGGEEDVMIRPDQRASQPLFRRTAYRLKLLQIVIGRPKVEPEEQAVCYLVIWK